MPTLFFDLMNDYYPDPDWDDLPFADKSDCRITDDDDECCEDEDDSTFDEYIDDLREDNNKFDRSIGKLAKGEKPKKITWLRPPSES